MPHKFKIGDVVSYYPKDRRANAPRGTCTITGRTPVKDGQPEYRIRHPGEDFERVALESELTAVDSEHGKR